MSLARSLESEDRVPARPPRGFVLLEGGTKIDWSKWYLTDEEDMGQSPEQHAVIQRMLGSLFELARERGWPEDKVFIGADSFFGWVEKEPLVRVSPDVYLLDDPPERPFPLSFQTWRTGHRAPRFALEVVSEKWKKDYDDAPDKYALLGTAELVIFDAGAGTTRVKRRERLQVFRRDELGALVRVYAGPGPAWSEELKAALVSIPVSGSLELAIARDPDGKDLVPTSAEALLRARRLLEDSAERLRQVERELENERQAKTEAERAKADAERAKIDAERAKEDAERAKIDAEQRLLEETNTRVSLERELAELKRKLARPSE
ncbi:MAG: Uma2 family endonuclease [Deltaproteobacteria bacterium]|nr:Uma2 family endonuclease [Deltaproteobacteria bacterium]